MNTTRLRTRLLSSYAKTRSPWPHYPHCPGCHRRIASSLRVVAGPTSEGRCPHCGADINPHHPPA